jgi:hypothetical protein
MDDDRGSLLRALFALAPVQAHLEDCRSMFAKKDMPVPGHESLFEYFVRICHASCPDEYVSGFQGDAYGFFLFFTNAIGSAQLAIDASDRSRSFAAIFHFFVDRVSAQSGPIDESYYACPLPYANSITAALAEWRSGRTFVQLPSVFVCQFSAFQVNSDQGIKKDYHPLQIPERLDLPDKDGPKQYELRSALIHKGTDIMSGHHLRVLREDCGWRLADGSYIRDMGAEEVGLFLREGYVQHHDELSVAMVFYQSVA